jgi:uncharacterized protein YidB (DUF937 family)
MSMDVFGQLLKGLAGAGTDTSATQMAPQQPGGTDLLHSIFDMLGGGQGGARQAAQETSGGGLSDIIRGFQDRGMGDVVSSWIGTGENQAVTPDQVQQGLGRERVQQAAQRSGLSMEAVLPMLAAALPMVIDALTPKGEVPDQVALQQGLQGLRRRVG